MSRTTGQIDHDCLPSKRLIRGAVYRAAVRVAEPGDIIFLITGTEGKPPLSWLNRLYRSWQGVVAEDTAFWHTAIYTGAVKERRGRLLVPKMIHAHRVGVTEEHIPPSFFTSERDGDARVVTDARLEIVRYEGLTSRQRESIVRYCRGQLGKPFADRTWRDDVLTYAFGLPARRRVDARVSCHGLAFEAYEQAGIAFPHHLQSAPFFNLAHVLGHPLGQGANRASSQRLYLRDHHLYRDNRFTCIFAAFDDPVTGELLAVENPGKYSWNSRLKEVYLKDHNVDMSSVETCQLAHSIPTAPA